MYGYAMMINRSCRSAFSNTINLIQLGGFKNISLKLPAYGHKNFDVLDSTRCLICRDDTLFCFCTLSLRMSNIYNKRESKNRYVATTLSFLPCHCFLYYLLVIFHRAPCICRFHLLEIRPLYIRVLGWIYTKTCRCHGLMYNIAHHTLYGVIFQGPWMYREPIPTKCCHDLIHMCHLAQISHRDLLVGLSSSHTPASMVNP